MATECQHRTNPDGTVDSICPYCYATIGKAHSETGLERMEIDHICDPEQLAHFQGGLTRASEPLAGHRIITKVEPIRRVG
jgi:hypothetical protein